MIRGRRFSCSWSGGKDSCFALYRALQEGGIPYCLLTMLCENGRQSRSHGLPASLLEKQAAALGIPLVTCAASWDGYETVFTTELMRLKMKGVEVGVFGDIDLEEHRAWVEKVCSRVSLGAFLPLWGQSHRDLALEFISLGFEAVIVAVKEEILDPASFLGRPLDARTLLELERLGIDVAGESGEFHTFVTGGPIFKQQIKLDTKGRVSFDGYSFLAFSQLG